MTVFVTSRPPSRSRLPADATAYPNREVAGFTRAIRGLKVRSKRRRVNRISL